MIDDEMYAREWTRNALCRGQDPRLWDIDNLGQRKTPAKEAEAKRRCRGCRVLVECARDALRNGDSNVIRAGIPLYLSNLADARRQLREIVGEDVERTRSNGAQGKPPKQFLLDRWDGKRCDTCEAKLRPQKYPEGLWPVPNCKAAFRYDRCSACAKAVARGENPQIRAKNAEIQRQRYWADKVCSKCDTPMRPRAGDPADWPGTKAAGANGLCGPCYSADKRPEPAPRFKHTNCIGCGTPLRPQSVPDSKAKPGTKRHWAHGLCQTCYRTTMPTPKPGDDPLWTDRKCRTCSELMRPERGTQDDWPGTKRHAAKGFCINCYMKERRDCA